MIDTVKLVFLCKQRLTPDNSPFVAFSRNDRGLPQSVILGSDFGKRDNLYYPKLEYSERPVGVVGAGMAYELAVECSLPKLLYGNNLKEVSEKDLYAIAKVLAGRMNTMGIDWVKPDDVLVATVRRIDYSKNVVLNGRVSATNAINDLSTANTPAYNDFGRRGYENEGLATHFFHTKHRDVGFYEKGYEMNADWQEMSVLRYEIKISTQKEIRSTFKQCGIDVPKGWTFQEFFSETISRKILNHYYERIYNSIPKIPLDGDKPLQVFTNILQNPEESDSGVIHALAVLGLRLLLKDAKDDRQVRALVEGRWGKKYAWSSVNGIRGTPEQKQLALLMEIRDAINDFNLLTDADVSAIK